MTVNEYNYAQLRQTAKALAETAKHNRAMESVEAGKLAETQRHQMVSESIDRDKVDESIRHDSSMEAIQRQSNYITDWYNRSRASQELSKIGISERSAEATIAKTQAETAKTQKDVQNYDRRLDSDMYAAYTQANAARDKSSAYVRNAQVNEFNAKVNAVLNTGKWITGTITDLGGMFSKAGVFPKQSTSNQGSTNSSVDPNAVKELEKELSGKGYWY